MTTFNADVNYTPILGAVIVLFVTIFLAGAKRHPRGLRFPPGPPGIPLLGNIMDMPSHHQWKTFAGWAHDYGGIVHLKVLGISIVIINSTEVARDLLEKRSSIYSDRYDFPMMMLMGWGWNWGLMKYGEKWRVHRKTFLRKFHPAAVKAYYPIQINWTRTLLLRLMESPDDFATHLRHHAGAIIMEILYGIQVLPKGDPYIETAEEAMAAVAEAANPGAFLIDLLPLLKYVPEWVPGAGFQRKARVWRVPITAMLERPFLAVKESLDSGVAAPSVTAAMLKELYQKGLHSTEQEQVIRSAGAVAYGAGSDTTNVALSWFILAMVLYPNVQRRAQDELDSVVGMGRLPRFEDRKQLPYINALCKEVQRWNPVAPLGLAHALSRDDIYGDYFIPRGSIVIGNIWAMLREEQTFGPRPEEFEPERFLDGARCDPDTAFGYGRRLVHNYGRYLATNTIFIAVASILKVFNISHARDKVGNEIPVKPLCTLGTITRPEEFRCSITPRSETTKYLLQSFDVAAGIQI